MQLPTIFSRILDQKRRKDFKYSLLLAACWVFIFSSCDDSFEPLQENDKYFFTISGYLDAAADTQWVRIAPARDQLNALPEVPQMQVTLEHIETGDTVIMKDSLFGASSDFNFINFYSLSNIEAGQTYQVKAERPDGRASYVTLTTPGEYPTPLFQRETSSFADPRIHFIIIPGVENLIDVQTWWFLRITINGSEQKKKVVFSYRNSAEWVATYGGAYIVEANEDEEESKIRKNLSLPPYPEGNIEILDRQVYVAVAGPEWDEKIADLSDLLYAQPEVLSNVKDGLGYMVGVYSKIIPYDSCLNETGGTLLPCELEEPYWYE